MKVIYISGKYRGLSEYEVRMNIRRAEEASIVVWKHGGMPFCPHKNSGGLGGVVPDETFLEGDIEMLRRCDAVYAIKGWEDSIGASNEIKVALEIGLPILFSSTEVIDFLKGEEDET